ELLAHALHRAGVEGVHRGEPLREADGADLGAHSQRDAVRERVREHRAMKKARRGVAEDRLDRHLLELLDELPGVVGLVGQQLVQVEAAEEDEGLGLAHAVSSLQGRGRCESCSSAASPRRTSTAAPAWWSTI